MQIPFNTSNSSNHSLMSQSSIERNRGAAWCLLETYMRPPPSHVANLAHESRTHGLVVLHVQLRSQGNLRLSCSS